MKVAVAFASKHGFTKGIAEFIAEKIRGNGIRAEALDVDEIQNPRDFDAFVIGSAVYMGSWMKEAKKFVKENRELLEQRPVWLFSSGPVGPDQMDKKGRAPREVLVSPEMIEELKTMLNPRDHRVFFGGYDSKGGGIGGWFIRRLPAADKVLIEGDFRNWDEIGNWAAGIAKELAA